MKKNFIRIHYVMREKGDPLTPGIYVSLRCYLDELTGVAYCDPEGQMRVKDLDIEAFPMEDMEIVYLRDDGTLWEAPKLAEGESEKPENEGLVKATVVPFSIVK